MSIIEMKDDKGYYHVPEDLVNKALDLFTKTEEKYAGGTWLTKGKIYTASINSQYSPYVKADDGTDWYMHDRWELLQGIQPNGERF